MTQKNFTVSVTGLGYVGLPLAVSLGKVFPTIGFDINEKRVKELNSGADHTGEVAPDELKASKVTYTSKLDDLKKANFHIVAVPTPVDDAHQPDLTPLIKASETIGKALKKGDIVVYESTVYPGCTEEDCVPVLEKFSGLKGGVDFKVGYSPERINPGDKEHTFEKIKKVVSGQDADSLEKIAFVYGSVVKAGIFKATTIKVAEAAKVIENTQRDLNIALMNELAVIFHRMDIDTKSVLEAAGTKWNFLKFSPGLVGGHCIGVDPYYLTQKAERHGYIPQVILAGRRINDSMGSYVARSAIKEMMLAGHNMQESLVTVLGLTFKENCPDLRNSKVIDIINELKSFGLRVQVADPLADKEEAMHEYGVELVPFEQLKKSAAVIVAVSHSQYAKMSLQDFKKMMTDKPVLVDVKSIFNPEEAQSAGLRFWRL